MNLLLFNSLFSYYIERDVRKLHPTPAENKEDEFKRYVDFFSGNNFDALPADNRWQIARSTFLAAKAESLGVGCGIF